MYVVLKSHEPPSKDSQEPQQRDLSAPGVGTIPEMAHAYVLVSGPQYLSGTGPSNWLEARGQGQVESKSVITQLRGLSPLIT